MTNHLISTRPHRTHGKKCTIQRTANLGWLGRPIRCRVHVPWSMLQLLHSLHLFLVSKKIWPFWPVCVHIWSEAVLGIWPLQCTTPVCVHIWSEAILGIWPLQCSTPVCVHIWSEAMLGTRHAHILCTPMSLSLIALHTLRSFLVDSW